MWQTNEQTITFIGHLVVTNRLCNAISSIGHGVVVNMLVKTI
jgi:hypothetical protein